MSQGLGLNLILEIFIILLKVQHTLLLKKSSLISQIIENTLVDIIFSGDSLKLSVNYK